MMQVPRILLTAPGSGTGKTMITCGILRALKDRSLRVSSFKCGPDYIDPMFHKKVLGIDSYNLDTFLCGRRGVQSILGRHGAQADIAVIEGVMGYYDGVAGISTDASAYDVAQCTDTPAVLIVDCKGMSISIVSVIQGFLNYRPDSHIRGVILNRLSPMMYGRMKSLIEQETNIKVYGYVPVMRDCVLESRYLGLCMPQELRRLDEQIRVLGEQMEATVDIEGLLDLARQAGSPHPQFRDETKLQPAAQPGTQPEMSEEEFPGLQIGLTKEEFSGLRIGLAEDEAFCFMYRDNLELLKAMGAKLILFSPLHDKKLPEDLDGIVLYGGYPELYAKELSANLSMRSDVRDALVHGLPCIAECGGFLYLQESLADEQGEEYPMAGVLAGRSYKTASLRRFGYVTLSGSSVFGQDVGDIPAHEFHYYESENCGNAFTARKPLSERSWECMVSTDTLLAGYPHIHYGGNPQIARVFLQACRERKVR